MSVPGRSGEVGRLRAVLMHRPGDEVLAVRAENAARLLCRRPDAARRKRWTAG
jgi:arginine deiminase